MNLSDMLNSIQLSDHSNTMMELVNLNEKTKEQGLALTQNDAKTLLVSRNKILHDYARVELSIEVLKELIEVFSASPYTHQDNYAVTLNELQEIFYYLKNETEDKVGDVKLIQQMNDYYNGYCGGSLELLRSKMEEFAENCRRDLLYHDSEWEGDE